ncbi:MAG: hypothetical protein ACI9HY_003686, partial [Planctomycetaceae bacterium]
RFWCVVPDCRCATTLNVFLVESHFVISTKPRAAKLTMFLSKQRLMR